jgi:diguanylate cyclase (GGDEF)-like protein/PAS domain S-box-containing protein
MDLKLNTTYVSPSVERLTGFAVERYLKMPVHEKHPPEYVRDMSAILMDELEREKDPAVSKQRSRVLEVQHFCADGRTIDLSINVSFLRDEKGIPTGILGVSRDITEQKALLRQLESSEREHRLLFATMAQGVVYQDGTGQIIAANPAAERILGLTLDQMQGRTSLDPHWHSIREDGSDFPGEEHAAMVALRTGKPSGPVVMGVYQPELGKHVWLSINAVPLFKPGESTPYQVYATFDDITQAREADENYRTLFERMLDGFALHEIICDETGEACDYRFLAVNPAFERLTGLSAKDIVGRTVREVLPGIEKRWINTYGHVALTGESAHFTDYSAALDMHFEVTVYRPAPGQFACIFADITERLRSEEALQASEARFRNIMASMHDIVFTLDAEQRHTGVFGPWVSQMGLTPDHFLGKTSNELLGELDGEVHMRAGERALQGEFIVYEWSVPTGDGVRYYQTSLSPIRERDGVVNGLVGVGRDISERKIMEQQVMHSRDLMNYVIQHDRGGVAVHDRDMNYIYVSQKYLDDYGISNENVIGRHHYEVFPDLPQAWRDVHKRALQGEVLRADEDLYVRADGSTEWTRWECRPWFEADGSIGGIIVYTEIITQRKLLERSVYREREQFRTTLFSIGDGVISTDTAGNIQIMNKVAEELTGWTQEEAIGLPLGTVFCIVNELTRETCQNPVHQVLQTGDTVELANHTLLLSRNGLETPVEDSAAPIRDLEGNITGVVLVFRDFTEKKEKQDRILFLSFHDQLTGLYNRRFFEEELRRLDTPRNLPLTLTMLDINGLKLINDAFGHNAGDEVLRKVADAMRQECRADDIIARIGGDEFMILLPRTDSKQAAAIAERLEAAISSQSVESVNLSVSYGYESKESEEQEMSAIFRQAEDHMYRRKLTESSSMRYRTITTIMRTLHEKNRREEEHSRRVGQLCVELGQTMGLAQSSLGELDTLGLMHDIGKIALSEDLLNKEGSLSDSEWRQIRRHPEIGYNILSSVNEYAVLAEHVLAHHERWDGSGYPRGLKEHEIPLQARMMAVADAFDAMTSFRPYREALSYSDALSELRRFSGSQFDPEVVDAFCRMIISAGEDGR